MKSANTYLPAFFKTLVIRYQQSNVSILTVNWPAVFSLALLVVGFFYLWSVFYHLYFTYSLESFSQPPWFVLQVMFENNSSGRQVLLTTGSMAFILCGVVLGSNLRQKTLNKAYGDAHFAVPREVRKMGLFATKGVMLGKYRGRYLYLDGDGHILVYWPTGAGKGVGIVIPNLLNWPGSVVCQDIKGENFEKTSGFRHKYGQHIVLLDFMNPKSMKYNPLAYVRRDPVCRIGDIQRVSFILFNRKDDKGDPWNPEARSLFMSIVLFLIDVYPTTVTIGEVLRVLKANQDFRHFIMVTLCEHGESIDPKAVDNFNSHLLKPHKEGSAVLTQMKSVLELWDNPIIDAVMSGNDFDLRELRKKPMSIYIKVQPGDIDIVSPLLNLFYQQVIDLMTRDEPGDDEPIHVLLPIDEFTATGKLSIMESSIAFMRSYHLKFMCIIQGPSQMDSTYGKDGARNFTANFAIQSVAAQNEPVSAKIVSDMLGQKTIKVESNSRKTYKVDHSGASSSVSRTGKPLMSVDQVKRMNKRKCIIFKEGEPPVYADKIKSYLNLRMLFRTKIKPVHIPDIDVLVCRQQAEKNKQRYIVDSEHPALQADLMTGFD